MAEAAPPLARKRTAPPQARRLQLIKATIRCVAQRGLTDTTTATVAREAGLSQGIINLHFQSKERLLVETLRYLADEYKRTWEKRLQEAGTSPADQLWAMVEVDFDRPVCERNKLAVWFAFWGEAKSRPTYRKLCADRDREYGDALRVLCGELARAGRYAKVNPERVATGLSAMTEGLWLDMLITPQTMTGEQAKRVCRAYLASVFPQHFEA